MEFFIKNIWLILFVLWGLPLSFYRSKFRKIVYQTDNWIINIKPVFWKELKGLFGNIYPDNVDYQKFRKFYLLYLSIYFLLFFGYLYFKSDSEQIAKPDEKSQIISFELNDQNGKLFRLDSVLGKKNLVIYFYPLDDSRGCTKQACAFRDQFEVFQAADAMIIGISAQSVQSHNAFATKNNLNYTLLSDPGNRVRELYGVPSNFFGLLPGRVTYVINKKGKMVYFFNSQTQTQKHVDEALRILHQIK